MIRQEVLSKERFVNTIMALKSQTRVSMDDQDECGESLYDVFMELIYEEENSSEIKEEAIEMKEEPIEIEEESIEIEGKSIENISINAPLEEDIECSGDLVENIEEIESICSKEPLEEIEDILDEEISYGDDLDKYIIDITYLDELEHYNDIELITTKIRGKSHLQIAFNMDDLGLAYS